jgi:hypothetical protein
MAWQQVKNVHKGRYEIIVWEMPFKKDMECEDFVYYLVYKMHKKYMYHVFILYIIMNPCILQSNLDSSLIMASLNICFLP